MGETPFADNAEQRATRVRYGVLAFACSLSMITYLDRVCIAKAATDIMKSLDLQSDGDMKWAYWAFTFAYAAFEIPTGWLGDVFGPRKTIIRIVLWWSLFTAITGLVGLPMGGIQFGFGALVVIRFLFGIGEAGAYPNITRALHNWFPYSERGLAQGAVWMSGRLMGGLTPLVWMLLTVSFGLEWRSIFWVFGGLGVIWCFAWAAWFRNRPDEKPTVNAAERHLILDGRQDAGAAHAGVPWLKLLADGNLWTLCIMYFCCAYGWYFNITYLPRFLETQHHVQKDSTVGAIYQGGPLWMGAVACLAGGWLSDRFIRRTGNRKWGRRLFGVIGHGLCALCYFACLFAPSAFTFFLAISLAAFWNDMTMGSAWAVCQDIGKRYSAIVAGFMNTIGNLGGAAATLIVGYVIDYSLADYAAAKGIAIAQLTDAQKAEGLLPGYQINFVSFGIVYIIGCLLWLRIDATKAVSQGDDAPPAE